MDLKEALSLLDHEDDSHWTSDGQPVLAVVSDLVGRKVSREEIIEAAPEMSRQAEEPKDDEILDEEPEAEEESGEPDVAQLLAQCDAEIVATDAELKSLAKKLEGLQLKRQELQRLVTSDYDYKTDMDRRLDHIRKSNARKAQIAADRQAMLAQLPPEVRATIGSPIDRAAPGRKAQPKVPPRLFEEQGK